MNGKDVFKGLQYLDSRYIEQAEFGEFDRAAFERDGKKVIGWRRGLMLAAVIALVSALVGCGVAYVLHLQDLKLGDREVIQEYWDEEQQNMVSETVQQQVLTFAGLKGSPNYEAAREWYEFKQAYDPDWKLYREYKDADKLHEPPAEYSLYNLYTQEMQDKVDEITEKYGLKLQGVPVKAFSGRELMAYLGMEGVLLPGAKASVDQFNVSYFDGGWFHTDMHMNLEEPEWPYSFLCSIYYSSKECFDTTVCELNEASDWQEWNYTTASGAEVLVIRSPSVWVSWVFCDRGDATITVRLETILEWYSDDSVERKAMSDEVLKQVLDCIDFSIAPQPGDPALLEGPEASKNLSQTQGGYTVTVKEVLTDGIRAKITLGLTAPEDVDLEQYLDAQTTDEPRLYFDHHRLLPPEGIESSGGGGSFGVRADNDGKANTVDYFMDMSARAREGIPFPEGGICHLSLQDLQVRQWNNEISQEEVLWKEEAGWNFEIPLDNGEWRELEFVSEPIVTRGSIGWDVNGNDVWKDLTITSIRLRAFGLTVQCIGEGTPELCDYKNEKFPTVVLKDGSTIRLNTEVFDEEDLDKLIPLDEVESLQLIDGTVLYPSEVDPDRQTDFSLEVKSAVTDGNTARITLGLTVPEGIELCKENCGYSVAFGNFGDYTILLPEEGAGFSRGTLTLGEELEAREDGDGRDDTLEILYTMYAFSPEDDSFVAFPPGSRWMVHIEGMSAERMEYPEGELTNIQPLWTSAGVRNVAFTFEGA